MVRLLFPLVVVIALVVSGYFLFINKSTSILPLKVNQAKVITQPVATTPEAGSSGSQKPVIATNESIDTDMTALDQDLLDVSQTDASFAADLGGI